MKMSTISAGHAHDVDELIRKSSEVEGLVSTASSELEPNHETKAASAKRRKNWFRELGDAILDLSTSLPQGTQDYDARKLFEFHYELGLAIENDPEALDAKGHVALAAARIRDVTTRISRRLTHNEFDENPETAFLFISERLKPLPATELARILGVSTKTVGTWAAGGPVARKQRRVTIVARLVSDLIAGLTASGVAMWFDAPRGQLSGRTPLELLNENEAAAHEALVTLARGSRGQLAD